MYTVPPVTLSKATDSRRPAREGSQSRLDEERFFATLKNDIDGILVLSNSVL